MIALLRRLEPDIALAAGRCGQPTKYLEPDNFAARFEPLKLQMLKQGVRRSYTACPNCNRLLSDLSCAGVVSVWETLDNLVVAFDLVNQHGQIFALHDPCPIRQDRVQDAVRSLLQQRGSPLLSFPGIAAGHSAAATSP